MTKNKENAARGAVTAEEAAKLQAAAANVKERPVPTALHPAVLPHRAGYTEDDRADETLTAAARAFGQFDRVIRDVHARERDIRADQTKTPEAHKLAVSKVAQKALDVPVNAFSNASAAVQRDIKAINAEIEKSFKSTLDRRDAEELRAVLRGMSRDARRKYLNDAKAQGNFRPIAAVLAHPEPIASGMTEAERQSLRHDYETALHGELIARRKKLQRAQEELDQGWQKFFSHMVGLQNEDTAAIQKAADAAEKAVAAPFTADDPEARDPS